MKRVLVLLFLLFFVSPAYAEVVVNGNGVIPDETIGKSRSVQTFHTNIPATVVSTSETGQTVSVATPTITPIVQEQIISTQSAKFIPVFIEPTASPTAIPEPTAFLTLQPTIQPTQVTNGGNIIPSLAAIWQSAVNFVIHLF